MSCEFNSPTTSTPNKTKGDKSKLKTDGFDQSSTVLRSLLGVSPVSAPPTLKRSCLGLSAESSGASNVKNKPGFNNNDSGFKTMSNSKD